MKIEIIDFYKLYEFVKLNCNSKEINDFLSLVTKDKNIIIKSEENSWNMKEIYNQVLQSMGVPESPKNNILDQFSNYRPLISLLEKVLLNNEWQTSNLIITIMMNMCKDETKMQIFHNEIVASWINKNQKLCMERMESISVERLD